jgi:hypothetical protein
MKHQQIDYQKKRRENLTMEVYYRNFAIMVHKFKPGDCYCDGYAFQILKPDSKLFWECGYMSVGHKTLHDGLSKMFWHIDRSLTDIYAEYFDAFWDDCLN